MTEATVLDIDRITSVLQRRCESSGVRLHWSSGAQTASTNGKTITLPVVHTPVTKDAMDKLYGFVIHESGHHSRPDAFKILKALPKDTPEALNALFNIAEDDGMERQVAHTYRGDAIALGRQNEVVLGEIAEAWKETKYPDEVTEQMVAPISVCALGQLSRLEWDGMSNNSRAAFFNSMHPVAKKLTDDLVNEGWVDKLLDTEDPHDTWDLAVDLYKRLYPEQDDEKTEELRDKGHSMEPSNDVGEDATARGSGDDIQEDGDASGKAAKKGDDEGDGTTPPEPQQGTVVSWKDAVLSEHNDWQPKEDGATPGSIGIDWTDYTEGEVALMPQHMINVIDCRKKSEQPEDENDWDGYGSPSSFMPNNQQSRAFGNQIRRYIQAQARTHVHREQYNGKLHRGSLVRLAMPPVDGGEWNKKLFYQFENKKELNTVIHVLTDWSGSMQGTKMVHAADASGRLVYVFDRVLRVPVQLAAFTNGRTRCDIGLIKAFGDKSISPRQIAENFSKFYKYSSANNDADSVMWAYNQLLQRKEKRKILLVLSDGAPAGSWAGSSSSNLLHVTKSIEKAGKVELYGIGIESNAVKTYYSNCKVLNDSDEINKTLFDIIKEGVK